MPLTVTNHGGNTHLTVDVTGYYKPQIQATLTYDRTATQPDGVYSFAGIRYGSARVLSSARTSTGNYRVVLDQDLTGCTASASSWGGPFVASAVIYGNVVRAYTFTLDNTAQASSGTPHDIYWTLHVMC